MADGPADGLFDSLATYSQLQSLIDAGEAEGQYLECKQPLGPQFGRDQRHFLGRAISGFANSGGGVIIWGMRTVQHEGSLDVLRQTTPIGNIGRFSQQVQRAAARVAEPTPVGIQHRVLKKDSADRAGVLVTFVPSTAGDPVRSAEDGKFYIRSGDELVSMPYDVLKRMFAGASGPDIQPLFDERLVKANEDEWEIPFFVSNKTSATGRDVQVSVEIENPEACEAVRSVGLDDISGVNPGKTLFVSTLSQPVYRGVSIIAGTLFVKMKREKRRRRRLDVRVTIFADKMRARQWRMRVQLAQKGFSVSQTNDDFLY
jgi:hypothetical protein